MLTSSLAGSYSAQECPVGGFQCSEQNGNLQLVHLNGKTATNSLSQRSRSSLGELGVELTVELVAVWLGAVSTECDKLLITHLMAAN